MEPIKTKDDIKKLLIFHEVQGVYELRLAVANSITQEFFDDLEDNLALDFFEDMINRMEQSLLETIRETREAMGR